MDILTISEEDRIFFCVSEIISCAKRLNHTEDIRCLEQKDETLIRQCFSGKIDIEFWFTFLKKRGVRRISCSVENSNKRFLLYVGYDNSIFDNMPMKYLDINVLAKELIFLDEDFRRIYLTYFDIFNNLS